MNTHTIQQIIVVFSFISQTNHLRYTHYKPSQKQIKSKSRHLKTQNGSKARSSNLYNTT